MCRDTDALYDPPNSRDESYRQALHELNIRQVPSILRRILEQKCPLRSKRLSSRDLERSWDKIESEDSQTRGRSLPPWALNDVVLCQALAIGTRTDENREQHQVRDGSISVDTISSYSSYGAITPRPPEPERRGDLLLASKVARNGSVWPFQADSSNTTSKTSSDSPARKIQKSTASHINTPRPFSSLHRTCSKPKFKQSRNEGIPKCYRKLRRYSRPQYYRSAPRSYESACSHDRSAAALLGKSDPQETGNKSQRLVQVEAAEIKPFSPDHPTKFNNQIRSFRNGSSITPTTSQRTPLRPQRSCSRSSSTLRRGSNPEGVAKSQVAKRNGPKARMIFHDHTQTKPRRNRPKAGKTRM